MKRAKPFTIRRIALGLAVAAIAPATAQASPIDMTGEDFRYVHSQAVADAKKRGRCDRPAEGRRPAALSASANAHQQDRPRLAHKADGGEAATSTERPVVEASPPTCPERAQRSLSISATFGMLDASAMEASTLLADLVVAALLASPSWARARGRPSLAQFSSASSR